LRSLAFFCTISFPFTALKRANIRLIIRPHEFAGVKSMSHTVPLLRRISAIFLLLIIVLRLAASAHAQQINVAKPETIANPPEVRKLEAGKPIEREMKGGESHTYQIALATGQYLDVAVEQKGIDVVVRVIAPDGKQLMEVDSPNGTEGREPVQFIAAASADYQLVIASLEKTAPLGRYEIRVLDLRVATANDRAALEKARWLQEATQLQTEADALSNAGKYDAAIPSAARALTLTEKALGAEHSDTGISVTKLGLLYYAKGDYDKAAPLFVRALAILEKALGAEHPYTASALNNLAALYDAQGDYGKAEPLYLRSLAIREKVLGAEHPSTAISINNLAELYRSKGDYAKAEPFYVRALAIKEKTLGAEHPGTATSFNNLAAMLKDKGDYKRAEPLYLRALTIFEKTAGKEHPFTITTLNNLADLYRIKGDYEKAEPLYIRVLAIREKSLGVEHPDTATSLNNLGGLYRMKGDLAKAAPLFVRALTIYEKTLGEEHPLTINSLNNLAILEQAMGNVAQAITLQNRCNEATERDFIRNLVTGSERQRLLYINRTARYLDLTLSLHTQFAPTDLLAERMALSMLLQRKGRALDAITDAIAALRRRASADDQKLLDQLTAARSQLSNATIKGAGKQSPAEHQANLKNLSEQVEKLEAELSRRSAEFRAQALPVTLGAVQTAVPDDAALIEFASYLPYDAKTQKFADRRYVAYLLTKTGEIQWVDLGEATKIDNAVKAFRAVLHQNAHGKLSDITGDVIPKARALDELILRPVRALVGDKKHLLISPDGSLNLIPFDALVDENNRYLVEGYSISYLTSGRDLLRLQTTKASNKAALVIANPDFDNGATSIKVTTTDTRIAQRVDPSQNDRQRIAHRTEARPGPRLGDVQLRPFGRLPGSAKEGEKLKKLLPEATVLTGERATESALKRAVSPSILHISTHGGFVVQQTPPQGNQQRGLPVDLDEETRNGALTAKAKVEDPLLRSGLFFAGANMGKSGDDDGVLTALEATALDLYGTKLVVLSACDTGIGEVRNGDGVYGLRRALVLAGSETQVMSLWAISDEGTRKLMVDYYKRLLKGEGRGEALRQARLKMLESKHHQHPYYWASFIQSGEWANLDGKR
jgi:CHAT domain-containing protein